MQIPTSFVPLKNISFLRTESRDRSWLNISFLTWADAEHAVAAMARSASARDKTSFRIEWADGERYEGHIEISRPMASSPAPLARHVHRALEFTAGRWRPGHMNDEQQQAFLAENEKYNPGRAAWAGRVLDGHDLGGAP